MIGLSSQHPLSATVSVVPTPAVSYSVWDSNTHRQLQCLWFQHPPSATVCFVPTPAVSYGVFRPNTHYQLLCLPSATVYVVPTPAVSYNVCHPVFHHKLHCLSSQHLPSAKCLWSQHLLATIATGPLIHLVSTTVSYGNTRCELHPLIWRRTRTQRLVLVTRRKARVLLLGLADPHAGPQETEILSVSLGRAKNNM